MDSRSSIYYIEGVSHSSPRTDSSTMPTPNDVARLFGCSPEQVRAQYAKNARQLRALEKTARITGKTIRGYSAAELRSLAETAQRQSEA